METKLNRGGFFFAAFTACAMFNRPDLLTHFLRIKGLMEYPRISPAKKKTTQILFLGTRQSRLSNNGKLN